MSYCLNPACASPNNPLTAKYCQSCGFMLGLSDRYRILKPIGAGGFSRTFLATDRRTDDPCVIKQCLPSQGGRPFADRRSPQPSPSPFALAEIDRFRQEAQRLADLGHHPQIPSLIATLEYAQAPVPALYLVQEWIVGQTLDAELAEDGPWSEEKVRSLLAELLPVLEFIHAHQVIHRDIKPQNIIRPETGGPLVLVDFGAAKQTSRTQLDRIGTVIGSAGYAAPEQTMGKAVYASDLYSLGVTCIYLLTGLHPFDLYSVSSDDWIWSHYLTTPISLPLMTLLDKMLRRSVNQRYRTATAVLTDLKASVVETTPAAIAPNTTKPSIHQNPLALWLNRLTLPSKREDLPRLSPPWQAFHRATPAAYLEDDSRSPTSRSGPCPALSLPSHAYTLAHTLAHPHRITAMAISPDGDILAIGDNQGAIVLWHLPSVTRLHGFPSQSLWQRDGHGDRLTALQFSPDGTLLLSSSAESTIKQWDILQYRLQRTLAGEGWGISALVLQGDGALMLTGGANGAIDLWDLDRGQFIQRLWSHTDEITGLTMTADGTNLLSGGNDGLIYRWDLRTAEAIASVRAHHHGVSVLALHPHGQVLITGGGDRTLRFWDVQSFRLLQTLEVNVDRVSALHIHPSGTLLASHDDDIHIQLWRLTLPLDKAPQRLSSLNQDWSINGVIFSPMGDRLVSSSTDGTLKIWQS